MRFHVVEEGEVGRVRLARREPALEPVSRQLTTGFDVPGAKVPREDLLGQLATLVLGVHLRAQDLIRALLVLEIPRVFDHVEALDEVLLLGDVRVGGEAIGAVPLRREELSQGLVALRQVLVCVVGAMFAGQQAREHRAVGRHGGATGGDAVLEDERLLRPPVQEGSGLALMPIEAHAVRARRVPNDEEHVGAHALAFSLG